MAGKLNGVMPAQTPTGCIMEWLSTPRPTLRECSPLSRWGMPQANSTTSSPRVSSPWASEKTLPCSRLMRRASSSLCCSISSLKRNITRARTSGGVWDQSAKARSALAMASRHSAAVERATVPCCWPVAGSKMAPKRSLRLSVVSPSMKLSIL